MKYRIKKKKNTLSRAKFIADKIGTIERGIWVEYFKKHPTDLSRTQSATTFSIRFTWVEGPDITTEGSDNDISPQVKPSSTTGNPSVIILGSTTNCTVLAVSK